MRKKFTYFLLAEHLEDRSVRLVGQVGLSPRLLLSLVGASGVERVPAVRTRISGPGDLYGLMGRHRVHVLYVPAQGRNERDYWFAAFLEGAETAPYFVGTRLYDRDCLMPGPFWEEWVLGTAGPR